MIDYKEEWDTWMPDQTQNRGQHNSWLQYAETVNTQAQETLGWSQWIAMTTTVNQQIKSIYSTSWNSSDFLVPGNQVKSWYVKLW